MAGYPDRVRMREISSCYEGDKTAVKKESGNELTPKS